MVEVKHVGMRVTADGNDPEGLTVKLLSEGCAIVVAVNVGYREHGKQGAYIRFGVMDKLKWCCDGVSNGYGEIVRGFSGTFDGKIPESGREKSRCEP